MADIDEQNTVCIIDFNGSEVSESGARWPTSYWADYYPDSREVRFGGDWVDFPTMTNLLAEPSKEAVEDYIEEHLAKGQLHECQ